MRYKPVYMPSAEPKVDAWFDTEEEAWDAIERMTCRFDTGEPCEMCQAEWSVFSEKEIEEIENET